MSAINDAPHRPMRRAARELNDPAALDRILREARVLFLGINDEPAPYVLPVSFGHEPGVIYVHSAAAGTKIELLAARPEVGFSACTEATIVPGDSACTFGCRAESVVGVGRARIVQSEEERLRGLAAIMRHYAGPDAPRAFASGPLSRTLVIAIDIVSLRAKRVG